MHGFVPAINAQKLEAYTQLFADNAVFVDSGRTFTGTDEIREFGASLIDDRSRYEIDQLTDNGDRAAMVYDYVAGIGGWYRLNDAQGEVVVEDCRIGTLRLD